MTGHCLDTVQRAKLDSGAAGLRHLSWPGRKIGLGMRVAMWAGMLPTHRSRARRPSDDDSDDDTDDDEPSSPRPRNLHPTARALQQLERRLAHVAGFYRLSPRQRQVLGLLVRGLSNKEIAQTFRCSEVTVEAHMTSLLRRTRSNGRAILIARFWLEFDLEPEADRERS